MEPCTEAIRSPADGMTLLATSWFSTRRVTEARARGSVNEEAVTSALLGLSCVSHITPVGLFARTEEPLLAAIPDGVADFDLTTLPEAASWIVEKSVLCHGKKLALATVEIKTRISAASLNEVIH